MRVLKTTGAGLAAALLAACGGGSGGGGTGTVSLAITDAPVDGVSEVVVEFEAIELKPREGAPIRFEFTEPLSVDLRSLTGDNTEVLLNGEAVPAGEYNWIRLVVNAAFDNVMDSYVLTEGGQQVELRVPSGEVRLVSGFTVVQGGELSFVVDWNLRLGLTDPPGQPGYLLRPAFRVIDLQEAGAIEGSVALALLSDPACTSDPNSGDGNEVYVYAGAGVVPDDIDGTEPEPVTTARVDPDDGSGAWRYRVAFLAPGDYTVAFTCQAADDLAPDPEAAGADPATDNAIAFTEGKTATVTAGSSTTVDFDLPPGS